jgi:hypothetical protein
MCLADFRSDILGVSIRTNYLTYSDIAFVLLPLSMPEAPLNSIYWNLKELLRCILSTSSHVTKCFGCQDIFKHRARDEMALGSYRCWGVRLCRLWYAALSQERLKSLLPSWTKFRLALPSPATNLISRLCERSALIFGPEFVHQILPSRQSAVSPNGLSRCCSRLGTVAQFVWVGMCLFLSLKTADKAWRSWNIADKHVGWKCDLVVHTVSVQR